MVEKVYSLRLSKDESPIRFIDKGRTKIEYYTENKEKQIDNKQSFGKKIANNIQNTLGNPIAPMGLPF